MDVQWHGMGQEQRNGYSGSCPSPVSLPLLQVRESVQERERERARKDIHITSTTESEKQNQCFERKK
jgi:hypothetical protein